MAFLSEEEQLRIHVSLQAKQAQILASKKKKNVHKSKMMMMQICKWTVYRIPQANIGFLSVPKPSHLEFHPG